MTLRAAYPLERVTRWDQALAQRCNRASHVPWVRFVFCSVSRLGDGIAWYALMLALLIHMGVDAVVPVVHMIGVGAACTVFYKLVKRNVPRLRPFETNVSVVLFAAPLDRFSFPSGHTLHAVGFTLVAIWHYPALAWVTVPFTLLVAASRVLLGLHYPSDVLVGAAIGATVAIASLGGS